jgi:hypothetical protein
MYFKIKVNQFIISNLGAVIVFYFIFYDRIHLVDDSEVTVNDMKIKQKNFNIFNLIGII